MLITQISRFVVSLGTKHGAKEMSYRELQTCLTKRGKLGTLGHSNSRPQGRREAGKH